MKLADYKKETTLTKAYVDGIKKAEGSNAQYIVTLATLAAAGNIDYNAISHANKTLLKAYKESNITTFKNVAALVARMVNKQTVKGKSVVFELDTYVIDSIMALGTDASMAKLQGVRKANKAPQTKPTKTTTGLADDIPKIDVKSEVAKMAPEAKIMTVAKEVAKLSPEDLKDEFYSLLTEVESLSMNFDPTKNVQTTAILIAKLKDIVQNF